MSTWKAHKREGLSFFMEFFATCAANLEKLVARELESLGASSVRPLTGQVAFTGDMLCAYRVCLESRLSSRIVVVLARVDAQDAETLYEQVHNLPWEDHLRRGGPLVISAHGTNQALRNTRFTEQKIKDAISDRMLERCGTLARFGTPQESLHVHVRVHGKRATIGIDLVGEPLFRRSYHAGSTTRRTGDSTAPRASGNASLRADYANALLFLAAPELLAAKDSPGAAAEAIVSEKDQAQAPLPTLTSPLCVWGKGSVVLALEAASCVLGLAAGRQHVQWAFESWLGHDADAWACACAQSRQREKARADLHLQLYCENEHVMKQAFIRAGMAHRVDVREGLPHKQALTLCDLEEGVTVGSHRSNNLLTQAFTLSELARLAAQLPDGSNIGVVARDVFAQDACVARALGSQPNRTLATTIGSNDATLSVTVLRSDRTRASLITLRNAQSTKVPVLLASSEQFASRLVKVAKQRARWAARKDISCYRVYDADLPDYAVAIDLYHTLAMKGSSARTCAIIAEYAPPKEIDPDRARARYLDVLTICPTVLSCAPEDIYIKQRSSSKGGSQYAAGIDSEHAGGSSRYAGRAHDRSSALTPHDRSSALTPHDRSPAMFVEEGGLIFEVDFTSRIDCGLFLDDRIIRSELRELAKPSSAGLASLASADAGTKFVGTRSAFAPHAPKSFLNLFGYTGSATCYAADGGAAQTTTVDLSRTYLNWAKRNMALNGFEGPQHEFIQADVLAWVHEQRHKHRRWDLIYCAPPTFSNSSRMRARSFDIQRDHVELLIDVSRLLAPGGMCIFSCNLRSFKPDLGALGKAGVTLKDTTRATIPQDFSRTPTIHRSYELRRVVTR